LSPTSELVGSVTTDENGVYLFEYKHKGKPSEYTLNLIPDGPTRSVMVKANSFNLENFEVPGP